MHTIRATGLLSLLLCASWLSDGFAQSIAEGTAQTLKSRQVVAEGAGSDVRITVVPGVVNCRTLLAEIGRLSSMQIRNLDRVPDDALYMEATGELLGSVVGKILAYAKVDYVLRSGDANGAPLLIVAEPTEAITSVASAPAEVLTDEPQPQPVPLEEAPPAAVELGLAPNWQTIEMTPREVTLPPEMVAPRTFTVTAPPPVPSAPAKTPSTIKH